MTNQKKIAPNKQRRDNRMLAQFVFLLDFPLFDLFRFKFLILNAKQKREQSSSGHKIINRKF